MKKINHRMNYPFKFKATSICEKEKDVPIVMNHFAVNSSVKLMYTTPSSTAQPQNSGFNQNACIMFMKSVISFSCIWIPFRFLNSLRTLCYDQIFEVQGSMEICSALWENQLSGMQIPFSFPFFNFYFFLNYLSSIVQSVHLLWIKPDVMSLYETH